MSCVLHLQINLLLNVDDPAAEIAAGYTHIEIQRATEKTGTYAEISTTETRPVLDASEALYRFYDTEGAPEYWYRSRFRNAAGTLTSGFTDPFLAPNPALDVISVEELKTLYLFGVDLTDDNGDPIPDSVFQHYIIEAVDHWEREIDIPIITKRIEGEEGSAEAQDYYREDYSKYIWLELDHFPVIEVLEVELVLPGEAVVQVFNREWIQLNRNTGQIQLVPGTGTAGTILLGASGSWIPLIYGHNRYIPHVFRIQYRAGFGPPSRGATDPTPGLTGPKSVRDPMLDRGLPQNIKHIVGMRAALGPFNIAGDLIVGAGIANQSISIDGLSQSIGTTSSATNAGYGARIIQYQKDIKVLEKSLKDFYKGVKLQVV
jgi:hypothetical protein